MEKAKTAIAALEACAETIRLPHADGQTVWRVWGEGPSLVLLHGGSGSWLHWVRNIAVLAQHFRVFVPDMPGFGDSDSLSSNSVTLLARSIADDLERLPIDPHYCIAGFSFGTWIGGLLLAHHQERVDRLVLVGAAGLGRTLPLSAGLRSWRRLPEASARRQAHRQNLEHIMLADPDSVDALAIEVQSRSAEACRFRHRAVSEKMMLKDCVERWPVKLTALWGTRDAFIGGHFEERRKVMLAVDPGAGFHLIEGAGHWVQFEASDATNRLLLAACSGAAMDTREKSVASLEE